MNAPEYAVVIEQAGRSFGAYVPDLPECAVTGRSRREGRASIRKAIAMYLEDVVADGEPVPAPTARIMWVPRPKLSRCKAMRRSRA